MMLQAIDRLYGKLVTGLVVVAGALVVFSVGLVIYDVIVRASGSRPPGFTVAFVEYILLYFTLLSGPYLVRHKGHVFLDMVMKSLTGTPRWILEKFVYIVCIAVSLVFVFMSWDILWESIRFGYVDTRSVDIPYWLLYFLYPICFSMIAIEFARFLFGVDSMYGHEKSLDSV